MSGHRTLRSSKSRKTRFYRWHGSHLSQGGRSPLACFEMTCHSPVMLYLFPTLQSLRLISLSSLEGRKKGAKKNTQKEFSPSLCLRHWVHFISYEIVSGEAMSLGRKFLSRKFSKSFKELSRAFREEPQEEKVPSPPCGEMGWVDSPAAGSSYGQSWATMLPDLLGEIIQRVEASEGEWSQRQNLVACAGVCKRWREITKAIVRIAPNSEKITFLSCLKQVIFFTISRIKLMVISWSEF